MRRGTLVHVLIAGVSAPTKCSGGHMRASERVSRPEETLFEIPHSSLGVEWLEGGMKGEDGHIYEEIYGSVLTMDRTVILYIVSGKLIQVCEHNPSRGSQNVEHRTEGVIQGMDLTKYHWRLGNNPIYEYVETFIRIGSNTSEAGEPDRPTGIYFTVDILSGGTNLRDESGRTNLPGEQWTARFYLESDNLLGGSFKGEAATDLPDGSYGYNNLWWVAIIDELKYVEKELNITDEERANKPQEEFRKPFLEADSFEVMGSELIQDCNKELASSDFGDASVDAAAAAEDRDDALMGWVANAHSKDSYTGDMAVSVAFESGGITCSLGFLVLEDTPRLGTRANEDVSKERFEGKGKEALTATDSRNLGDSQIDAINGTAIAPKAVVNTASRAMYYVHHYTEAGEQVLQLFYTRTG